MIREADEDEMVPKERLVVPADCGKCGACCRSDSSSFVPLLGGNQKRLGSQLAALTEVRHGQLYMRMRDGVCTALDESEGLSRCSVYDSRPDVCRTFQQGSDECLSHLVDIRKL